MSRSKIYVVFCTVGTILSARSDPSVARALARGLVVPDGMPLVWIAKGHGLGVDRIYGPDFMLEFFAGSGRTLSHFFYGGHDDIPERMASRLKERFPDLVVAGWRTPPEAMDPHNPPSDDIEAINASGADVLWVGLGHPKQDVFMYANRDRINAPVLAGVGAAFDYHSGAKREAPRWMKRTGLQWLHRLILEPRRLWRRYLVGNTLFLLLLFREWAKQRLFRRHP